VDNGILGELTFQVQPGATGQYLWPISLTSVETTEDGYVNHQLQTAAATLNVRSPVAAHITPSAGLVDGKFSLDVSGDSGASYIVEASTDLVHWSVIGTVVPSNGSAALTDVDSVAYQNRFYRVKAN